MAVRKKNRAEPGVSESIGFILIFTMVMTGIGLVTLYGYPMLINQQTSANERIMEKNMIVLQNDVKSLAYKTVPYKESSLKVEGGSLTVYNTMSTPAVSTIDIQDCPGAGSNVYLSTFHSGDLRYYSASADTDISLQNGAVVMRPHSRPGSSMLAEPRWFYDSATNAIVVNLIGFNSSDIFSLSGTGTVQMAMGNTNYTYISPLPGSLCIKYTPTSTQDYSVAWNNYFMKVLNNPPYTSVSPSGSPGTGLPITYTVSSTTPMTLVIKKYDVVIKGL